MTNTALMAPRQDNPDAAVLAAWGRRSVAYALYSAPDHNPDNLKPLVTVDNAENEIRKAVAVSPLGVEIQLWTALFHTDVTTSHGEAAAANVMDLDYFMAKESHFDWKDRLILAALNSLRTMRTGGAA